MQFNFMNFDFAFHQVSRNLEAAHDWFKNKFDSLQDELASSK